MFVSGLVWALLAEGKPGRYFGTDGAGDGGKGWRLWTEEVVGGLSSFVLTWTLFYGLVRV